MNPEHAALVAASVREHRFVDVEIRGDGGQAWRGVRGEEATGSTVQQMPGYLTQLVDADDQVMLMTQDFPGGAAAWPQAGWQVRFGGARVRRLTGPAAVVDTARLFLTAPLGPPPRAETVVEEA